MTNRLLIALCCVIHAQTPSPVRLYPLDETGRDPAFRSYIGKLQSAVKARNIGTLRKLVDPEVVVGPAEDEKGWTKFSERWGLNAGGESPVWAAISGLLALGCIREHPSLFLSPYLVWRFPRDLDRATHLVVIRDGAVLREGPALSATAAASLSFDIVRRLGQPQGGEELGRWVQVRTLDGKSGYLNTRDVMSPLMPRAQFGKRRGRWILIALEGEGR